MAMRWLAVYRRNLLVWRKLIVASVLGNIADPLITLVAFGYGLGQLLPQIEGSPYIVFLAAGSLCMSTMMAASFEVLYSGYSRMQVQRTWETILNTPVKLADIVVAEWLWAATKSLFSGIAILAVIMALDISRSPLLFAVLPVIALLGLCFAAIGLCVTAVARGYDFFSYYFTLVLTPMVFVSGIYYPMAGLPSWIAGPASWLPLATAVQLVRPLVLGRIPDQLLAAMLTLAGFTGLAILAAYQLIRRRLTA
jgi:lipooligosaccharide transport system permease protein